MTLLFEACVAALVVLIVFAFWADGKDWFGE